MFRWTLESPRIEKHRCWDIVRKSGRNSTTEIEKQNKRIRTQRIEWDVASMTSREAMRGRPQNRVTSHEAMLTWRQSDVRRSYEVRTTRQSDVTWAQEKTSRKNCHLCQMKLVLLWFNVPIELILNMVVFTEKLYKYLSKQTKSTKDVEDWCYLLDE